MEPKKKIMKILSVEDNAIDSRVMNRFLKIYGQCIVVPDGLEAVKVTEKGIENKEPFDLIFMDIMMPNLDGIGALKRIRKIEKETSTKPSKVIFVTSLKKSCEALSELPESFYDGYIQKPVTFEKLQSQLLALDLTNSHKL